MVSLNELGSDTSRLASPAMAALVDVSETAICCNVVTAESRELCSNTGANELERKLAHSQQQVVALQWELRCWHLAADNDFSCGGPSMDDGPAGRWSRLEAMRRGADPAFGPCRQRAASPSVLAPLRRSRSWPLSVSSNSPWQTAGVHLFVPASVNDTPAPSGATKQQPRPPSQPTTGGCTLPAVVGWSWGPTPPSRSPVQRKLQERTVSNIPNTGRTTMNGRPVHSRAMDRSPEQMHGSLPSAPSPQNSSCVVCRSEPSAFRQCPSCTARYCFYGCLQSWYDHSRPSRPAPVAARVLWMEDARLIAELLPPSGGAAPCVSGRVDPPESHGKVELLLSQTVGGPIMVERVEQHGGRSAHTGTRCRWIIAAVDGLVLGSPGSGSTWSPSQGNVLTLEEPGSCKNCKARFDVAEYHRVGGSCRRDYEDLINTAEGDADPDGYRNGI